VPVYHVDARSRGKADTADRGASQPDGKRGTSMRCHPCNSPKHNRRISSTIFDAYLFFTLKTYHFDTSQHNMASPESKDVSIPPVFNEIAMPAMEVEQQNLCNRCRSLDLEHPTSQIVYIPVSSLNPDCCCCDSFRMIVSESIGRSGTYTAHQLIVYSPEYKGSNVTLRLTFEKVSTQGGKSEQQDDTFLLVPLRHQREKSRQTTRSFLDDEPAEISLVRSSLETCRKSHSDCHRKRYSISVPLKVLNCQSRTLCTIDSNASYAALSYVWGNLPAEPLLKPQTLPLPKTLEDALFVCQHMDIPYLWVDRYCIDQGNAQEKHTLISQMDKIYRGSELTIIAAAGENPNHGLPGVNGTPWRRRIEFQKGDLSFIVSRSPFCEVESSTWSKRGWTYQEVLLSPRRLYFTNWGILFECQSLSARNRVPEDSGLFMPIDDRPIYSWPQSDQPFSEIYHRICEYCNRDLTYSEDAIRGIGAILHSFQFTHKYYFPVGDIEGTQTIYHFYGVPCTSYEPSRNVSFLTSLLWEGCYLKVPTESMQTFPSWSWAIRKTSAQGWLKFPRFIFFDTVEIACPLSIILTHKTRGEESLSDFGEQDDYTSYRPWFRIDTWLLSGQAQHPITAHKDFMLDTIGEPESWKTDNIMAVNLIAHGSKEYTYSEFLLVKQTAQDAFRRLGCLRLCIRNPTEQWETDLHSSMGLIKAASLKQVQGLVPDMKWEVQERTVRLV
jgi:hypothetical protein